MFFFLCFFFFFYVFVFLSVAFLTFYERHVLGLSQNRLGPNKVSFFGFFQSLFDGFKLFFKELVYPFNSSMLFFFFMPFLVFLVLFLDWLVLPFFFFFF